LERKSNMGQDAVEKIEPGPRAEDQVVPDVDLKAEIAEDDGEVFKSHTGAAEFRALGWYVIDHPIYAGMHGLL
jgi:hypothetical protein